MDNECFDSMESENLEDKIETEEPEKKETMLKCLKRKKFKYLTYAAILAAIWILCKVVLIFCIVPTRSMQGTVPVKSCVIASRLDHTYERYDIVAFYSLDEPDVLYLKRIIGLPGETIRVRKGLAYVKQDNGQYKELDYSFIRNVPVSDEEMEFTIPENCYFMMGDNRDESHDSRYWDNPYVPSENIVGVGKYVFYFSNVQYKEK